jgi:hypothetical protein
MGGDIAWEILQGSEEVRVIIHRPSLAATKKSPGFAEKRAVC